MLYLLPIAHQLQDNRIESNHAFQKRYKNCLSRILQIYSIGKIFEEWSKDYDRLPINTTSREVCDTIYVDTVTRKTNKKVCTEDRENSWVKKISDEMYADTIGLFIVGESHIVNKVSPQQADGVFS